MTAITVAGLVERGRDVAVVAPRSPPSADSAPADSVRAWSPAGGLTTIPSVSLQTHPDIRLFAPTLATVARVLHGFRPDLVHCATELFIGRIAQLAASRLRIPCVSFHHPGFASRAANDMLRPLRAPIEAFAGALSCKEPLRLHAARGDAHLASRPGNSGGPAVGARSRRASISSGQS